MNIVAGTIVATIRICIASVGLLLVTAAAQAQSPPIRHANIVYGPSNQLLDIFVPAGPARKTMLLFIHGGGFKQGSKEDMALYAYLYAQGGFVSATMNYRLTSTPNNIFPAAFDDTRAAIEFLKQQAPSYGYDPRRIILVGYSAGGNLALMAGLAANSGVAAIVSAAGPTDLASLIATATDPQLVIDMNAYLAGQAPQLASPLYSVRPGNPAVLLFHGDADSLVPIAQSQVMLAVLLANHVPAALHTFSAGHEIMLPFAGNPSLKPLLDDITRLAVIVEQIP